MDQTFEVRQKNLKEARKLEQQTRKIENLLYEKTAKAKEMRHDLLERQNNMAQFSQLIDSSRQLLAQKKKMRENLEQEREKTSKEI